MREALGLLAIQAPLSGLGRGTGGWDEGMALMRELGTEIAGEGLWEQSGGGGGGALSPPRNESLLKDPALWAFMWVY